MRRHDLETLSRRREIEMCEKGVPECRPYCGNSICAVSLAVGQECFDARVESLHPVSATSPGLAALCVKLKASKCEA